MHNQKRRKKRQTHGVKTVEIARGRNGYGFTISGQQPCILSCIVAGSPAEKAGLKAGDLLLAVNGDNISRAPHDDAVRLIGSSSGVLVLQIAENQNSSDSSDDDYHYSQKPRSKFPSRLRNRNQNIYRSEKVIADLKAGVIFHERTNLTKPVRKHGSPAAVTVDSRTYTDGTHNSGKTKSYCKFASPTMDGNSNEPPLSNRHEVIHVFGPPEKVEKPEERRRSPLNNNLRQAVNFARSLPNLVPSVIQAPDCEVPSGESRILRVVVGYIGSIEVPAECSRPNSQILSIKNAVRRLHVEQRIHTLVLLEVDSDEVRLRNVHGKTVAVYPADKLAFSGVCPDDKTFFGLITFQAMESNESTSPHSRNPNNISSSCHVFMVKSDLRHHSSHSEHAWSFGFKCNQHDDVCLEFPWSADPILRAIASIQKVCVDPDSFVDLNAANQSFSSNSDSGLGFGREEINNDQVYVVDCNEENSHQVKMVDYRLTREANRISSALRPYHRPQLSLGAESVSSAFVSSQPYKTSTTPVDALQGSPLSDSFRVPSSILSNTFSPKDNLDQQNSADNLRKNMHKLLTARNRYSHDLQSGSSDAESVRSENTHVRSQSISNTPNRPVSVPNDQTFGVSHRHLHTLKISSPERINKLSPRAITPRKEINDKYYDEELPENLQRTLHNAMDHVVQSENKKPLVQSLKDSGDETLKQGKIGSTAVSSSNVCDNQPHGKSGRKSEGTGRATGWAISLDKLLTDHAGRAALKEFLRKEFSEENIVFWTVCEDYRKINDFEQRKVFGKEIVKKHLCLRSSEPVNIDSHARKQAEDNLDRADVNLFNEAQAQIFQLMKHDSYNRFLKSDVYKQCVIADIENLPYPFVTAEDIKKVEVSTVERKKSKKIKNSCSFDEGQEEKRKKSFSLWYKGGKGKKDPHKRSIKVKDNDSKKLPSSRSKDEVNSCKVILPDGCTITVTFQPGQTLQSVVENVCHERNLPLSSLEVLQLGCDKPLDLTLGASSFDSKEIILERRVLFRMDLPNKKYLGVKAKPTRSIAEVFQPILRKYDLKLDGVVLHLAGSSSPVDTNAQISTVENQRIMVQSCDDYAEWGGFDLMTKQNTPAVCHQQDNHPKPSDSLEAITNKVFEDLFDFNEPTVFDELGVMDFATKNEEKRRYSTNSNNSKSPGPFMFSRRRSSLDKYPRSKNRSRLSLPSSQKHLPNKMAAMKIKDPDDDRFFDLLSKVQSKRIDDQRGLSDKYELPEFLKTDHFRLSQRSTSAGDLSEAVLSIANLNKSFSQPEGLDDSSCNRTTPTPELSFMNADLDHSYILPSHDEADLLFSHGRIVSPDFTDPNLTKKSIRDIGFDNKQSCHHVSTPIEFLNVSYQSTPCSGNGKLTKRLSARARSNSPFNEKNRTVVDISTVSPNNLDCIDLDSTLTEHDCASQSFNVCRNSAITDEMKTTVNLPLNSYAEKNHPSTVQTTRKRSSPLNLQFVSADERPMSCPPNSSSFQTVNHRKPPPVPEKPNRLQLKASSVGIVPKLTNAEDLNSDHSNISLCSLDDLPSPSTHELIPPLSDNTSFQQNLLSQKDVKVTFV